MQAPTISVIVPVYKVEKYLARCVDSILGQTFRDLEVLLVDDGSPDRCGALCDAYAGKDSRVRVLHKENGGLSDARNAGIDAARGEWLAFVDSDDFVEPEFLQVLHDLATAHGADIAVCGIRDCFEGKSIGRTQEEAQETVLTGTEGLRAVLLGKELPISVCTKLIRRELCLEHRFLKGRTYEDAFYAPGLFLRAKKVAATTRSLYNYWHRADSITTKPFSARNMDVVDAYTYTLEQVREHCPELEAVAQFRLYWAHFVVLDKLLMTKGYQKLPQYGAVKGFLKKHTWKIFRNAHFTRARRLGALALGVHVGLYRLLVLWQNKRTDIHD